MKCFNSFILPCLEYCSPVWSTAADSHLKLFDRNLQACKFLIPNFKISLQHRCFISSLCTLYKIFHNPSHPLHSELPNLFHPRRVIRGSLSINSLSFSPMRFHPSQYSRCFIPATTKLWNELPRLLLLSSLMLLLFLLGIAVLPSFIGPVHLSVKGKLISSTLLLLKNVSGPYPKKSSTTSVTPTFPYLIALIAL